MNNSSRDSSQVNDSHNQNNQISAPEMDTVDADISRGTGQHASCDYDHTAHDSHCDVNPDCQHGQFQDWNSHKNDVVFDSDIAGRVAKIEFSDPKVHENTLRIKIGHLNSVALIDTGATLSILRESLLDKLNPRNVKYVKPTFSVVYGIGSQQHEITTKIEADFFIEGHKFTQGFHVMKNQYPVILGLDFLVAHGTQINLDESRVIIDDNVFKLLAPPTRSILA